MDFRREATDKLRCYEAKRSSIGHLSGEIKRLEEEFVSIRGASSGGDPVSGGGESRDDALVNNISLRNELSRAKQATEAWLKVVDGALGILSEEEFCILDGMYIQRKKGGVDQLCEELHIEKSALYKRRNEALRQFTMALYGVTEL